MEIPKGDIPAQICPTCGKTCMSAKHEGRKREKRAQKAPFPVRITFVSLGDKADSQV